MNSSQKRKSDDHEGPDSTATASGAQAYPRKRVALAVGEVFIPRPAALLNPLVRGLQAA